MQVFKPLATPVLCGLMALAAPQSAFSQDTTKSPDQLSIKPLPDFKLCPDLKADLTLSGGNNGMVKINGTVTNISKGNYNIASVVEIIMNLAYAPQYSYNKTGVSDILATRSFSTLKPGASFMLNANFKIPDFGGWTSGNAKRLFTLRIVKQNMSPYQAGEECNPDNNSTSAVAAYRDKSH